MFESLRRLARSQEYQFLYSRAKELGTINIFNNTSDFTEIQIRFLQWLAIYDSLYQDLQEQKEYINQEVIEDDLRTEAYLLYRYIKSKEPKKSLNNNKRQIDNSGGIPSVIFKRGK